ncbi:hypothetical protein F5B19DRAFT_475607 [Rostrohypoxylon terebratum]|nr:hypothetical protein F5B19DRAFT_475607 [Rostrohypoxylon terebratum]
MRQDSSWLAVAEESIRQDLDTSRKELILIRDLLGESDIRSTTSETLGSRPKDRTFCMRACQEYSGSRVHMLEERIRQIQLWSSNERVGKEIPDRVPDEWNKVDIEWRKWLSKQTTSQTVPYKKQSAESHPNEGFDILVRVWGPLISLLEIYSG